MKRIVLAAALVLAGAVSGAALAASDRSPDDSFSAQTERGAAPSSGRHEGHGARFAEGFFDHFRGDERHRHHRHHWDDDDDDDDDGSASADRGGGNRPADPNAADKPVPDSGIFNGKARPKVEVQ
jgi:hypothetical protein